MRDGSSIDAHLAAEADDICNGVASEIYRARSARKGDSLGEDILVPSLD